MGTRLVPIIIVVLPQSVHGVLHSLARANSALQTNIANNSVTLTTMSRSRFKGYILSQVTGGGAGMD